MMSITRQLDSGRVDNGDVTCKLHSRQIFVVILSIMQWNRRDVVGVRSKENESQELTSCPKVVEKQENTRSSEV